MDFLGVVNSALLSSFFAFRFLEVLSDLDGGGDFGNRGCVEGGGSSSIASTTSSSSSSCSSSLWSLLLLVVAAPRGTNRCLSACAGTDCRIAGAGASASLMDGTAGECVMIMRRVIGLGATHSLKSMKMNLSS